jgi:hypothetical protein
MNCRPSQFAKRLLPAAKSRSWIFAVACLFLLGFSLQAFGQEATILGTVTDPSGSVVPNVTVTITHVETGESRSSNTNDSGQYSAPALTIGHYNVAAKASGFAPVEQKDLVLNVNDRLRVDLVLKVGAASETVSVEANAVRVQSDSKRGQHRHRRSTSRGAGNQRAQRLLALRSDPRSLQPPKRPYHSHSGLRR